MLSQLGMGQLSLSSLEKMVRGQLPPDPRPLFPRAPLGDAFIWPYLQKGSCGGHPWMPGCHSPSSFSNLGRVLGTEKGCVLQRTVGEGCMMQQTHPPPPQYLSERESGTV